MSLVFQTLGLADIDEVYAYAERRLALEIPDEIARRFRSWEVAWRKEALEHYLKLGWSFIVRRESAEGEESGAAVAGFFLAQPFLFFRGQTQTVWVEHVEADDSEVKQALIEVAVRVAREKNFQRALFAEAEKLEPELLKWAPKPLPDRIAEVRTSKG